MITEQHIKVFRSWQADWNRFACDVLKVNLDKEQREILDAVQHHPRVSVTSGTARGKDFVAAVSAVCFLYLTPKWNEAGELIENTKVAMTAPTDRQVGNIMFPEVSRLFNRAKFLPGRLVGYDIRTQNDEWFLTGFKADEKNHEAWSGFHAANTMFIVTEASGISESIFTAIEGNLQGNSRILIVFNPNTATGYAARSQKTSRWKKFRLDSLSSPNVISGKIEIPGQVDFNWVKDKVEHWCTPIDPRIKSEVEGDFEFNGAYYRPNDLFRVKVRGMFPKVSTDKLIPMEWVELANQRWRETQFNPNIPQRLGVDVAGMGRDESVFCHRYENYVKDFEVVGTAGKADHMRIAGEIAHILKAQTDKAFIDTIGEGAGVYSALEEQEFKNVFSCKFSESADGLTDITGVYKFANMRAYLFWCIRDWLNPVNGYNPCLPPCDEFLQEATEIKWKFHHLKDNIIIEPKDDIKTRLGKSIDYFDALANTFYPHDTLVDENQNLDGVFF